MAEQGTILADARARADRFMAQHADALGAPGRAPELRDALAKILCDAMLCQRRRDENAPRVRGRK